MAGIDGRARTGKEARPHPIRVIADAEIEAGRLHLVFADRRIGADLALGDHRPQILGGKNAAGTNGDGRLTPAGRLAAARVTRFAGHHRRSNLFS